MVCLDCGLGVVPLKLMSYQREGRNASIVTPIVQTFLDNVPRGVRGGQRAVAAVTVGLKTKLTAGVALDDLIRDVTHALQEILNISVVPAIEAAQFIGREWLPLTTPYELSSESPIIGLRIKGEPEIAWISIYERTADRFPEPDWKPEELGQIASIEVSGSRTGLSLAMVAAIAVAIARHSGGLISDEIKFYTSSFDCSHDDFLRSTRITEKMDHYRAAANRFEQQLFKDHFKPRMTRIKKPDLPRRSLSFSIA